MGVVEFAVQAADSRRKIEFARDLRVQLLQPRLLPVRLERIN